LEMVKRSLQNDEQEALNLIDQLRKVEERAADLEAAYAEAAQVVEPKRNELLAQRAAAQEEFKSLTEKRGTFVATIDKAQLKVYDAIRSGGRSVAVAPLTSDGACGHCFGMVPLQLRNEIRHSESLIRCEACGVILSTPGDEPQTAVTRAREADEEQAAEVDVAESVDAPGDEALEEGSAAVVADGDEGRAGD